VDFFQRSAHKSNLIKLLRFGIIEQIIIYTLRNKMPKRRRYARRRRRKRRALKRRRRYKASRYVPSGIQSNRVVRMRFVHAGDLISQGDILVANAIRANDINNPLALTTIQPSYMGHDQLKQQYNRYLVVGSRARVVFNQQTDVGVGSNAWCGVHLSDDPSAAYTRFQDFMMAKKGKQVQLVAQRNQTRTVSCNYSAKGWWNVSDVRDNQDLGASMERPPNKICHYIVWKQNINAGITDQKDIAYTLIIDAFVVLSDPKELAPS